MNSNLQQNVCDANLSKLCLVQVEENTVLTNLLSFVIFACQIILFIGVFTIFRVLKLSSFHGQGGRILRTLFFGYLADNQLDLWLSLWLTIICFVLPNAIVGIGRILGLLILIFMAIFYSLSALAPRSKQLSSVTPLGDDERLVNDPNAGRNKNTNLPLCSKLKIYSIYLLSMWMELFKKAIMVEYVVTWTKVFISYDLALTLILSFGSYFKFVQPILWLIVELCYMVYICKYRIIFINRHLKWRCIVLSSLFPILVLMMVVLAFPVHNYAQILIGRVIFTLSFIILLIDICYSIFEYFRILKSLFSSKKSIDVQKVATSEQISYAKPKISERSGLTSQQTLRLHKSKKPLLEPVIFNQSVSIVNNFALSSPQDISDLKSAVKIKRPSPSLNGSQSQLKLPSGVPLAQTVSLSIRPDRLSKPRVKLTSSNKLNTSSNE